MRKRKNQLNPMDKPLYNYWTASVLSFYLPNLYVDVGKRWKGLGWTYLLLILALFSLPYTVKLMHNLQEQFQQQLIVPMERLPLLQVRGGKIFVDKPMPLYIKNDKNQVVILIDTTGQVTDFPQDLPEVNILITQDKILFKAPSAAWLQQANGNKKAPPIIHTLDASFTGTFDGKAFVQSARVANLQRFSQAMIYPIVLSLLYAIALTLFAVLALLAQFVSRLFFALRIKYTQASRLLIVSSTPMLLVLFIFMFFDIAFYGTGIIMCTLLFGYFIFALRAMKRSAAMVLGNDAVFRQ